MHARGRRPREWSPSRIDPTRGPPRTWGDPAPRPTQARRRERTRRLKVAALSTPEREPTASPSRAGRAARASRAHRVAHAQHAERCPPSRRPRRPPSPSRRSRRPRGASALPRPRCRAHHCARRRTAGGRRATRSSQLKQQQQQQQQHASLRGAARTSRSLRPRASAAMLVVFDQAKGRGNGGPGEASSPSSQLLRFSSGPRSEEGGDEA